MSPDQIAWARAVAEESYDGQLIRDLCNALETAQSVDWAELARPLQADAWASGYQACFTNQRPFRNPYIR